jgi:LAS superfamily LD-carboxypeptidase LdcB
LLSSKEITKKIEREKKRIILPYEQDVSKQETNKKAAERMKKMALAGQKRVHEIERNRTDMGAR